MGATYHLETSLETMLMFISTLPMMMSLSMPNWYLFQLTFSKIQLGTTKRAFKMTQMRKMLNLIVLLQNNHLNMEVGTIIEKQFLLKLFYYDVIKDSSYFYHLND